LTNSVRLAPDLAPNLVIVHLVSFDQVGDILRFLRWVPFLNPGDMPEAEKGDDILAAAYPDEWYF
jgi:hypothetical protein